MKSHIAAWGVPAQEFKKNLNSKMEQQNQEVGGLDEQKDYLFSNNMARCAG